MTAGSFYFDPEAEGTAVFLGPTEARLMDLAWEHHELTVKTALHFLGKNGGLAYTTVMTVLNRLAAKALLTRSKGGRNFVYHPTVDRRTFLDERIKLIRRCLKSNFYSIRGHGAPRAT